MISVEECIGVYREIKGYVARAIEPQASKVRLLAPSVLGCQTLPIKTIIIKRWFSFLTCLSLLFHQFFVKYYLEISNKCVQCSKLPLIAWNVESSTKMQQLKDFYAGRERLRFTTHVPWAGRVNC